MRYKGMYKRYVSAGLVAAMLLSSIEGSGVRIRAEEDSTGTASLGNATAGNASEVNASAGDASETDAKIQTLMGGEIDGASWIYGESPKTPSIEPAVEEGLVTYHYFRKIDFSKEDSDATSWAELPHDFKNSEPKDAGYYYVYASIDRDGVEASEENPYEDQNHMDDEKAKPAYFTIEKRALAFTSGDGAWVYDGNPKHNQNKPKVSGTFAKGDL